MSETDVRAPAAVKRFLGSSYFHPPGRNLVVQGLWSALCAIAQVVFVALDALFGHHGDSLDHLLVARKERQQADGSHR